MTENGWYEFLRMPFCMNSCRATLVGEMKKLLQGFNHVKNYINDLIVYMKDWNTHQQELDDHFFHLQQAHQAVQPMKFGSKSIQFLGHLIGGFALRSMKKNWKKLSKPIVRP